MDTDRNDLLLELTQLDDVDQKILYWLYYYHKFIYPCIIRNDMAIGKYRDSPADMDELEREIAAAQYPEGGLVVGIGLGIVVGMITLEMLLVLTPFLGGLLGYVLGCRLRRRKIRRVRARIADGDSDHRA